MRRWFIGFNDYWYTASVWLEEVPWYLIAAENVVMWLCHALHYIPIPKRWREDYGSLGGLFHAHVCNSITQFVWRKTEHTTISLPFFFLKKMFPKELEDDGDDFWEGDKQRENNEKLAKDLDKAFKDAYNKVGEHENLINRGKEKEDEV